MGSGLGEDTSDVDVTKVDQQADDKFAKADNDSETAAKKPPSAISPD